MLDIVNSIVERTISMSKEYEFLQGAEDSFREIILSEFSLIKENDGIKILDSESDYSTDDGVFIYFSKPLSIVHVKNFQANKKNISDRKAVEIISLSYIGRQMSAMPINTKEEMTDISKRLSLLIE